MTYQRNISEKALYQLVEDVVPDREVEAGEEAEDDHDAGRLRNLRCRSATARGAARPTPGRRS